MTTQKTVSHISLPVIANFAIIYIVWGSTFLAIRIAVASTPPLLAAGLRFFTAGLLLYGFGRVRGLRSPSLLQWRNIAAVSLSMFVITYGALFWAEKYVPSGIASVLAATVPLSTMILETLVFRQQRFRVSLLIAALVGFAGVTILTWQGTGQRIAIWPCMAILVGSTGWSLGSVLSRTLQLPESKVVTAGAEMMVGGFGLLLWSLLAGELHPLPHIPLPAVWALLYLVTAGSLLGFTAFVWLLGRMPATRVASYAYVNPVVAMFLGYFLGHEALSTRTFLGTALVLGSVVLTLGKRESQPASSETDKLDRCDRCGVEPESAIARD